MACLLNLLILSFVEQFLIFMESNLSIISFKYCAFSVVLKSYHHTQAHLGFLLLISQSFIVLCFILRSIIHLELIFVKVIRSVVSIFNFFRVDVQLFHNFCWKCNLCSIVLTLLFRQRSFDYIYLGLFLSYLFSSADLFVLFFHQYHTVFISAIL